MTEPPAADTFPPMQEDWQIRYVRHVLAKSGLSASAVAKRAKFASTTLTRALNSPDHKFQMSLATIRKIEEATGIPYAPFLADSKPPESDPVVAAILDRLSKLGAADRDLILSVSEGLLARSQEAKP